MDDPPDSTPESKAAPSESSPTDPQETGVILSADVTIDAAHNRIVQFIRETIASSDTGGVVVNMRGDVDTTVTAALAVEALGPDHVYGLILPCNKLGEPSARNAETLAGALGIEHDTIHLRPLLTQFGAVVNDQFRMHEDHISIEAVITGLRTTLTYLAADERDALVCGTTNRSDRLLGNVVEYGTGDADLSPISHLFQTDVRVMAELLDIPEFVTSDTQVGRRPPRDASGPDLTDEDLDWVLRLHVDKGLDAEEVANEVNLNAGTVSTVLTRYDRVERERRRPHRLDSEAETR